jgi:citrate lyase subunit beta/citryl-CoA lyase
METPESVFNALEIANSSPRVKGLLFGCEDFLTDMEGDHGVGGRSLLVPRHMVSMACRAAGITPIDTPYVQVKNLDGLREHIQQARELGFEGMLVMTPAQIEIAHELYTPSQAEVEAAKEMVALAQKAEEDDRGIIVFNGIFVSPPTLKRAKKVVARFEAIEKHKKNNVCGQ